MIALGLLHISAATRFYDTLTPAVLWFVSGGLATILTGALNLLNRLYGRAALGLRRVCGAANFIMTAFTCLSGVVGHASPAQLVVVTGLFAGASILALMPSSLTNRGAA